MGIIKDSKNKVQQIRDLGSQYGEKAVRYLAEFSPNKDGKVHSITFSCNIGYIRTNKIETDTLDGMLSYLQDNDCIITNVLSATIPDQGILTGSKDYIVYTVLYCYRRI